MISVKKRVVTTTIRTVGTETVRTDVITESEGGEGDDIDTSELDAAMDAFVAIADRFSSEWSAASRKVSEAADRIHQQQKKPNR